MNGNDQNQPDSRPLDVDYFYVAVDQQCEGYRLLGMPVSPYFRTREEAKTFHTTFEIKGSYCVRASFFPSNEEEAKQFINMIFGSETEPAMAGPICNQVEKNAAKQA